MDKVNSSQFDTLIGGSKPVVCDFFATWCGPCKMLGPVIEQVAADHADKAVFVKVDVDECPDLAARYGIMSIPFVAVFKNGQMTAKTLGFMRRIRNFKYLSLNMACSGPRQTCRGPLHICVFF